MLRETGDRSHHSIKLTPGTYQLTHPIDLPSTLVADGLSFIGDPAGKVVLTSAVSSKRFRIEDGKVRYRFAAKEIPLPTPRAIQINGHLQSSARHPNVGYLRIESASPDRRSGFQFRAGDLPNDLDLTLGECDLVFLHDWSCSRLPVAEIETSQSGRLTTVGPIGCQAAHYAIDHFEKHPRYYLEGHPVFAGR